MTDTYVAPGGGEAISPAVTTPAPETVDEVRAAAQRLAARRAEKLKQQSPSATNDVARAAMAGTVETEESAPVDAAPPVEVPGEMTEKAEPEAPPPIEPPRSWSKEEKAEFATYPREAQEKIAKREQDRERALRQAQNEAAEQRKAIDADRSKVEQARQHYESALPILLENLQSAMAGEFSDIKTMADVQRLANEDFPRYVRWDAQQKQLAAVQQEITAAQTRQAQEKQTQLQEFRTSEARKLIDALPDLADEKALAQAQTAAVAVLKDVGFKDDELGTFVRGEKDISVHDHRFQRIVHEAAQWREAKAKAQAAKAVPKPPVQRPGVAQPKTSVADAQLQALKQKAFSTGDAKAMAAYVAAKRAANRPTAR